VLMHLDGFTFRRVSSRPYPGELRDKDPRRMCVVRLRMRRDPRINSACLMSFRLFGVLVDRADARTSTDARLIVP